MTGRTLNLLYKQHDVDNSRERVAGNALIYDTVTLISMQKFLNEENARIKE